MLSVSIKDISDELTKKDTAYLELLVSHLQTGSKLKNTTLYSFNNQGVYIVNSIIETYTKIFIKSMSQLPIGGSLVNVADALYKPSSLFLEVLNIPESKTHINQQIHLKEIANTIVNYVNMQNEIKEPKEQYFCIDEYKNEYRVFDNYCIKVTTSDGTEKYIDFPYALNCDNKLDVLFIGKEAVFMILYNKTTSAITVYGGRLTYKNQVPDIDWLKYSRTLTVDYNIGTLRFINDGLVLSYPDTDKLHILTISNKASCLNYYICDYNTHKDNLKDLVLSRYQATEYTEED